MQKEYKITASFWRDTEGHLNGFAVLDDWLLRWIPDWRDPTSKDSPRLAVDHITEAEIPKQLAIGIYDLLALAAVRKAAKRGPEATAYMHEYIAKVERRLGRFATSPDFVGGPQP